MTISIWRYSHLALALTSAIFVFIAAVTGVILALEPISKQLKPYAIKNTNELSLAESLDHLQHRYNSIITLKKDDNNFFIASVLTKSGKSDTFYVDPFTGKKIGVLLKKHPFFEFATNLHRSLFLKSTGRFLVGLFSFLLFLIAITGLKLILKRQGGFKGYFSKVIKENFEQYYHVVIGRYALIPILIITLTGLFLSLEKFNVIPATTLVHKENDNISSNIKRDVSDFEIFRTTTLDNFKSLEFPFSQNEDDYFVLELNDKELFVNQYSGSEFSEAKKPLAQMASTISMTLHTGQGTILWAILLLLSCLSILFFMYTGFLMALKRYNKSAKMKNKYAKDEAEYILLVGSETGHTQRFAQQFFKALIAGGYKVYLDTLNNYSIYKSAKQLVVFTATYGEGEAPSNADKFIKLVTTVIQKQSIDYSVLAFGSLMYPEFCKYGIDLDAVFKKLPNFKENLPLFKINNQSFEGFKTWLKQWNETTCQNLNIQLKQSQINKKKLKNFEVVFNSGCNIDNTFLLQLKPKKSQKFQSGDLLAFYPEADSIERLYSIGKVNNTIILSIKKHEFGICSKYLSTLTQHHTMKAKIKRNLDFHFPSYAKEVIMIANGTGIAPFIGMINNNTLSVKTHLFWGGRTQASFALYSKFIDKSFKSNNLTSFHIAYSQEQEEKIYVQDVLAKKENLVCQVLQNGGVIMICGAITMQNRVLEVLNEMTNSKLQQPLNVFENNEQIMMDCY